ncbi:hypothetical protein AB1Y20_003604 [Prymnesium parvum]|uniref:WW domain-containing protein n=1 Tax=Prymnesium parvum TaxID=97485 RepID=A0AB34J735_PRYPA
MAEELPPEWEAVTDAEGRTYWWNVRTNETTWKKPVLVVAKKEVAAGYVSSVRSEDSTFKKNSSTDHEIEAVRSRASVGDLTAKFGRGCSTSSSSNDVGKPTKPEELSGTSSAKSVAALKKLQEAKEYLAKTEEERKSSSSAVVAPVLEEKKGKPPPRREKGWPPKVDLYK